MKHSWMLDVLADLSAYAQKNELSALAEQLDDTRHLAVSELVKLAEATMMPTAEGGEPLGALNDKRVGGII